MPESAANKPSARHPEADDAENSTGNGMPPEPDSPPRELNRLEVLRGLRVATWEASFATIWASLTGGAFLTGYALWLGADTVAIGFLTAIPTFAGLIQLVSSYFGERLKARKPFSAWFFTLGRLVWLPILLLPLLLGHRSALIPFLLLYALSFVLLNIPMPAYMSWMSDLVPADHRGRYFARRNMIAGIVGMLIGLPAAWFLDVATRKHHWEAAGFGTLFGVGVGGALLSFICLLRQPEPHLHKPPRDEEAPQGLAGVLHYYRAPFADANFRRLIVFNTVLGTGQFFAAPFFTVYALQNLGLNYVSLQIFATISSLASLASMPLWGYLADKFGNKPLLAIGAFGTFTLPLHWALTTPHNRPLTLLLVTMVHIGGLAWAGVGLTQFNMLIRLSPPGKTPIYVATMAAVTGLAGGIAPLLGGAMMKALAGWHTTILGREVQNYHATFLVAALLRLLALIFLRPVEDGEASTARDVLQQIGRANPKAWLHIRRLQRGGDMEGRLRATEALGESRTRLAVNELETALFDPSFEVREEAARALGEIGDPHAVEPLLDALRDPASGIVSTTACALGRIGDRRANPPLIALLQTEGETVSRPDRIAAAQALGQLGGPDAVEALLKTLVPSEEELAEAIVRALGEIGDEQAVVALAALLEEPTTGRTLQMALIRALGELHSLKALPVLHRKLAEADGDSTLLPPLADTLAHIGDSNAIFPLLDQLSRLDSALARRQVANAIGTLLGENEGLYPLLAQEHFARDNSVSRLLQEMQRKLRATDSPSDRLTPALERYIEGDYQECLQTFHTVGQSLSVGTAEETENRHLCTQVLEHLASLPSPPLEATLIGLFALRALLEE